MGRGVRPGGFVGRGVLPAEFMGRGVRWLRWARCTAPWRMTAMVPLAPAAPPRRAHTINVAKVGSGPARTQTAPTIATARAAEATGRPTLAETWVPPRRKVRV